MSRAPEPCQRPRSTERADAFAALVEAGPVSLDRAAELLPAGVGANSARPAHRRREVARAILDGLRDEGRAVLGPDGLYRRARR